MPAAFVTPTATELPDYLRVDEYRRIMRVGRGAVYAAIKNKTLPHVKVGRLIRIPREAVQVQQ